MEKLPPQSLEAEQSVLGGILIDPKNSLDQVSDVLIDEDFYKPAHQKIYKAIRDVCKKSEAVDIVTVTNQLSEKNQLDLSGGASYLAEIIDKTPSSAHIESYAKIVRDKALLRALISKASNIIEKTYKQNFEDTQKFLDSVEAEIFSLSHTKDTQPLAPAETIVKASIEKLQDLYAQKEELTGISSGFYDLDKLTAGFQSGELIILAARPSMGKTALSLNMCLHGALKEKKKVAYFSLEMAKEQLMMRMLASVARISLSGIRVGKIADSAWESLIHTASQISQSSVYIDDSSLISPFEIRSKCRRLKARTGLDMVFVDYLQLMGIKGSSESREREVAEISRNLKAVAKELQVPVIALAQLNRGVESRGDRRPLLQDLRESGSIEQDADTIMMLYREEYYDRENPHIKGRAELIINKQRNGPTGKVDLHWEPKYGVFENAVEDFAGPEPPMPTPPPSTYEENNSGPNFPIKNFAPGANT